VLGSEGRSAANADFAYVYGNGAADFETVTLGLEWRKKSKKILSVLLEVVKRLKTQNKADLFSKHGPHAVTHPLARRVRGDFGHEPQSSANSVFILLQHTDE
jgi:hypothetical protein